MGKGLEGPRRTEENEERRGGRLGQKDAQRFRRMTVEVDQEIQENNCGSRSNAHMRPQRQRLHFGP